MPFCVVSDWAYFPGNEPACARVWVPWFWFALLHFYTPQLFSLALVFRLRTPDEPPYQGGVLVQHNFPLAPSTLVVPPRILLSQIFLCGFSYFACSRNGA